MYFYRQVYIIILTNQVWEVLQSRGVPSKASKKLKEPFHPFMWSEDQLWVTLESLFEFKVEHLP